MPGEAKAGQGSSEVAVPEPAPSPETYRLDTGDHLRIHFYDRYDREDLNGNYVIGENGQIRLARIGVFNARDITTARLERDIQRSVEARGEKLGYFSIDVARCRPFYVSGQVNRPGPYTFQPGLTILHAVSLAGGLYRLPMTSAAEAVRERRTLTETMSRAAELIARRARLEAERDGAKTIPVPPELVQLDPLRARQIVAGESALLDQSRQVIDREKLGLESLADLKKKEAADYEHEIERLRKRIEEQTKIFTHLEKLYQDRVINQQRFIEAVVALDGLQRDKQGVIAGLSQVNSALEKAQRDLALLVLADKARIAKEIIDTNFEIARLKQSAAQTAAQTKELATGFESLASASQSSSGLVATYKIMRRKADGQYDYVQANETTPIMAGDVVQVDIHAEVGPLFANW